LNSTFINFATFWFISLTIVSTGLFSVIMIKVKIVIVLLLICSFSQPSHSELWIRKKESDIVPGRFIVEFEHRVKISAYQLSNPVNQVSNPELFTQMVFYNQVRSLGLKVKPIRNFTSSLFNGASFDILSNNRNYAELLQKIKDTGNVKNIWPAQYIKLFDKSATLRDTSIWNPHNFTGVETLHRRGLTGKGIKVAVIDTGIAYTHPALGGGLGIGFKVERGYNFVGDGAQVDELSPNRNPFDCQGHGTHVAGIVAGASEKFTGVAPNATLFAYKIFSCSGNPTDDILVSAFEKAYFDGADIITCSVGSAGTGFLTDPSSALASKIAELGVFISVAAGNEGRVGPYFPSSPASGELITSVASVEARDLLSWKGLAKSTNGDFTSFEYVTTTGYASDIYGTLDLLVFETCSKLMLLPKSENNRTAILFPASGHCVDHSFYNRAKNLGYPVVLNYLTTEAARFVYNQPAMGADFQISLFGTTDYSFGKWAIRQTSLGNKVLINILGKTSQVASPYKSAGFLNTFTTWGPTYEGRFYPNIAAPGGNIFSTYLNDRYAIMSGTSMATPYIAGVAALYFESIGGRPRVNRAGTNLRKKLIGTADLLKLYSGGINDLENDTAPIIQQGSGIVNAVQLLDTKTTVDSDPAVSLVGQDKIEKAFTIRIENLHNTTKTYTIKNFPSITVYTKTKAGTNTKLFPPYSHEQLELRLLTNQSVSVAPGVTQKITLRFKLPQGVDFSQFPVFQGKILIETADETIGVPYVGM
jgi:subtilisin family serine protease